MYTFLFKARVRYPRWGALSTLGWFVVLATIVLLAQQLIFGMYIGEYKKEYLSALSKNYSILDISRIKKELQYDGSSFYLTTIPSFAIAILFLFGVVKLKKNSRYTDYLALRVPPLRSIEIWFIILVVYLFIANILVLLLGKPAPPEFIKTIFMTADSKILILVTIVIITPLFHELIFRGFLISGFEASAIAPLGAILVSSVIWTFMCFLLGLEVHLLLLLFVFGCLLGLARVQSGSLLLPIGMHMFVNLATMLFILNSLK